MYVCMGVAHAVRLVGKMIWDFVCERFGVRLFWVPLFFLFFLLGSGLLSVYVVRSLKGARGNFFGAESWVRGRSMWGKLQHNTIFNSGWSFGIVLDHGTIITGIDIMDSVPWTTDCSIEHKNGGGVLAYISKQESSHRCVLSSMKTMFEEITMCYSSAPKVQ